MHHLQDVMFLGQKAMYLVMLLSLPPILVGTAAGLIGGTGLPADIAALGLSQDDLAPGRAALIPHRCADRR